MCVAYDVYDYDKRNIYPQEVISIGGDILKTDALRRVTLDREQREAILDAFEASGMTGQAFALHHGIKIQTFTSWIPQSRHTRVSGVRCGVAIKRFFPIF
jgi:hypothetical protein